MAYNLKKSLALLAAAGDGEGKLSRVVALTRDAAWGTAAVAKKLARSTGKAAWIAGTTAIIFVVPLVLLLDREALLNDAEMEQASLLGTTASPAFPVPAN